MRKLESVTSAHASVRAFKILAASLACDPVACVSGSEDPLQCGMDQGTSLRLSHWIWLFFVQACWTEVTLP